MKILPCPFCGEKPEVTTLGSHIEIFCCTGYSRQKTDYMSYEERQENDFCYETYLYPPPIEKMILEQVVAEWNTRYVNSHKGYLADLRNKYGRVNTYFQLLERVQDPDCPEGIKELFEDCKKDIFEANEQFTELLRTDINDWEANQ